MKSRDRAPRGNTHASLVTILSPSPLEPAYYEKLVANRLISRGTTCISSTIGTGRGLERAELNMS